MLSSSTKRREVCAQKADYPYMAKQAKTCNTTCTDVPGTIVKTFVDVPSWKDRCPGGCCDPSAYFGGHSGQSIRLPILQDQESSLTTSVVPEEILITVSLGMVLVAALFNIFVMLVLSLEFCNLPTESFFVCSEI